MTTAAISMAAIPSPRQLSPAKSPRRDRSTVFPSNPFRQPNSPRTRHPSLCLSSALPGQSRNRISCAIARTAATALRHARTMQSKKLPRDLVPSQALPFSMPIVRPVGCARIFLASQPVEPKLLLIQSLSLWERQRSPRNSAWPIREQPARYAANAVQFQEQSRWPSENPSSSKTHVPDAAFVGTCAQLPKMPSC